MSDTGAGYERNKKKDKPSANTCAFKYSVGAVALSAAVVGIIFVLSAFFVYQTIATYRNVEIDASQVQLDTKIRQMRGAMDRLRERADDLYRIQQKLEYRRQVKLNTLRKIQNDQSVALEAPKKLTPPIITPTTNSYTFKAKPIEPQTVLSPQNVVSLPSTLPDTEPGGENTLNRKARVEIPTVIVNFSDNNTSNKNEPKEIPNGSVNRLNNTSTSNTSNLGIIPQVTSNAINLSKLSISKPNVTTTTTNPSLPVVPNTKTTPPAQVTHQTEHVNDKKFILPDANNNNFTKTLKTPNVFTTNTTNAPSLPIVTNTTVFTPEQGTLKKEGLQLKPTLITSNPTNAISTQTPAISFKSHSPIKVGTSIPQPKSPLMTGNPTNAVSTQTPAISFKSHSPIKVGTSIPQQNVNPKAENTHNYPVKNALNPPLVTNINAVTQLTHSDNNVITTPPPPVKNTTKENATNIKHVNSTKPYKVIDTNDDKSCIQYEETPEKGFIKGNYKNDKCLNIMRKSDYANLSEHAFCSENDRGLAIKWFTECSKSNNNNINKKTYLNTDSLKKIDVIHSSEKVVPNQNKGNWVANIIGNTLDVVDMLGG